ncbi:MAG: cysteine desulfurase [Methylococcaceae bacterium]|nr:cysteine desulfurase [Methylococcaceae bacterium]
MTTNNTNLPDIEQLTRLANQLFTALPCDGSLLNTGVHAVSPQAATATADSGKLAELANLAEQHVEPPVETVELQKLLANYSTVSRSDVPSSTLTAPGFYFLDAAQQQQAISSLGSASQALSQQSAANADLNKVTGHSSLAGQHVELPAETLELHKLLASHATVHRSGTQGNGVTEATTTPTFYFLDAQKPHRDLNTLGLAGSHPAFDVHAVRRDFPILRERVNGQPLAWLDNAATTQKPQVVIDRISAFYQHENSNIHRAAHELAARSTDAYEKARKTVADFLHASSPEEIVFVRGSTEAINLVAQSWGRQNIGKGDEIVITWLEHHANIVPWKQLCDATGAVLRVAPVDDNGQVLLDEYAKLLNSRTKLVSFTQVSNALGTITPAQDMIELAHRVGAKVLLDGAQSVSHLSVDVQALNCDWLVFSGHKIFGPTGIGVLYGKAEILEATQPWQGGGNMIEDVTFERIIYQAAPARFEAGTGNIADAVGLGAALEYLQSIGVPNVARYEHELLGYAIEALRGINGLRLIGTAAEKTSVLSFVLKGHSTQDVGEALNKAGIAVRSGHHCAQPILRRFGLEATVRPSLAFYNTYEEIDRLVSVVRQVQAGQIGFY